MDCTPSSDVLSRQDLYEGGKVKYRQVAGSDESANGGENEKGTAFFSGGACVVKRNRFSEDDFFIGDGPLLGLGFFILTWRKIARSLT